MVRNYYMQRLDEMPVNEAITMYYEKPDALRRGDIVKLLELKNKCPEIFDKIKDAEIFDMIEYANEFKKTDRYNELSRQLVKDTLSIINNDSINK
jgi:hypothetical protein